MNIPNQLILMTDEHTRKVLGCYGNKIVQTPNLDKLAKRGTRFTNAYTNVPICVPSRASFATGQYAHTTGHWDNATPYFGEPASWGTHLQAAGISVGSIGKLHYRNAEDPVGLDFQKIPMHVVNGVGDLLGCVREPLPKRWKARSLAENIGPGETNYNAYDRQICDESISWLRRNGTVKAPWVLFISMVAPHFPLIAPEAYYSLYDKIGMMPQKPRPNDEHPWFTAMRDCQITDNFTPDKTRIALASYYALVSFVDNLIGKILSELDDLGLTNNTQITYLSDHGDNIGERDLWGKSNFYEESVGIPCIIAGPSIPENKVCDTPISLIDIHPTILTTAGLKPDPSKPGRSIADIANEKSDTDRVIFSEYHAMGAVSGAFMIRQGRWKYIHYLCMRAQLFDLETDPDELNDLGTSQQHKSVCERMEGILRSICTPEEIDKAARTAQREIIDAHGGIDAVVQKGGFGATPPPGAKPKFA